MLERAALQCWLLRKQPKHPPMLLRSPFQLECSTLWTLCMLNSRIPGLGLGSLPRLCAIDSKWDLSLQQQRRGRFYILSHLYWPQGHSTGYLAATAASQRLQVWMMVVYEVYWWCLFLNHYHKRHAVMSRCITLLIFFFLFFIIIKLSFIK